MFVSFFSHTVCYWLIHAYPAIVNGVSTTATVVDRCTGCSEFDVDLSPAAFNDLAEPSLGRVQVTWVLN